MTPPTGVATQSAAEQKVFRLLEATNLGPHARAIHSLNISEHEYKLCGELDFIVLAPEGLFVLEVKGGRVSLHDGIWYYTDRFGSPHKNSEGPFRQARSGMFSLRERLKSDLPTAVTAGLVIGNGVVLPDTPFTDASPEWAPAMVIDLDKMRGQTDLAEPLRALIAYWRGKTPRGQLIPPTRLDKIADYLRPEFDKVPSLRYRADQIYAAMEQLTEEQYMQLDMVEETDRVLCAGGAGTGKSFLAAEVARRDAFHGAHVLVTCRSPILAEFLRRRLDDPKIEVMSIDRTASYTGPAFDVLVVDEAQDLMDLETLDLLDHLLRGGLEKGKWRFFYDANNQSSLTGTFDPDALEYLRSFAGAGGHLRRNCRNTRAIVTQTQLLTRADLGNPAAGWGPPPTYEFFDNQDEEARLLENHLRALLDEDVAPGEITILSSHPYHESCIARMKRKWKQRITALDTTAMATWPPTELTFATIEDFKGLENQFVAVVDIEALGSDERSRNLLYVAMSRARAGLWIAIEARLREELEAIKQQYAHDLQEEAAIVSD